MPHKRLEQVWSSGGTAFGGWVGNDSPAAVEAFARAGYDYVGIDTQHTLLTEVDAGRLLYALATTDTAALVRVAGNIPALINKVVDAGADGVIVPMVNTAAEAEAAVAATRYSPRGIRSLGPMRPHLGIDIAALEERVSVFVMVETAEAISNVDAICAVDGVAGIYVGPGDLAITLGQPPLSAFADPPNPTVVEAIEVACAAAKRAGIIPGIHGGSGAAGVRFSEMGFQLISLPSDGQLLAQGAAQHLQQAKAVATPA